MRYFRNFFVFVNKGFFCPRKGFNALFGFFSAEVCGPATSGGQQRKNVSGPTHLLLEWIAAPKEQYSSHRGQKDQSVGDHKVKVCSVHSSII
jgi:hypothetical protein